MAKGKNQAKKAILLPEFTAISVSALYAAYFLLQPVSGRMPSHTQPCRGLQVQAFRRAWIFPVVYAADAVFPQRLKERLIPDSGLLRFLWVYQRHS